MQNLIPGSEQKPVAAFVKGGVLKPNVQANSSISKQPFIQQAAATGKDGLADNSASVNRAMQPNMSTNQGYQPPASNQAQPADSVQFNNLGSNISQGVNFAMDNQQVPMAAGGASVSAYGQGKSFANYGFTGGINAAASNQFHGRNVAVSMSAEASADDGKMTQEEINKQKFKPAYAYFVLFIVLLCRIMVQWQRKSLNYAYGYTGLGAQAGDAMYELRSMYPQLNQWYGLLTGLIYTVPYSFFGLVAGKISDSVNRKLFLGIVVALASCTVGFSAATSSFFLFSFMRVIHGCLNSASNPLSFSLIADYFPPENRATANSIIQAGNYVGVGVSSISIILISAFGWRAQYSIMALVGAAFAALTVLGIKEPERGRYLSDEAKRQEKEKKEKEAAEAANSDKNPISAFLDNIGLVFKLPTARNVLIASSLRNFGGMIVSSFLPVFFGRNFPAYKAEYAALNALALSGCGMAASLGGGIIADKFEKKSYMTKAILCVQGCFLSPFLIALGTLQTGNFYLGVLCYALKVLVSGTYSGPAITMIQNTSPQSQQGNVVSLYFFCITMAQTLSPAIFTAIANKYGALTNPALYGPLITTFVAASYWGSIPFWWKAGQSYKKHMEDKENEAAAA